MKILVLDVEHSTGAFKPWEQGYYMTCVGLVMEKGGERTEELIWFDHRDTEATPDGLSTIQDRVDEADLVVCHNAKHDVSIMRAFGISFRDTPLHCTMVSDYLIEGQDKKISYKLNEVAARYNLGQKHDEIATYWAKGVDTFYIPMWKLGPYCVQDCILTLDIYHAQIPRIEKAKLWKVVDLQNEYTYTLSDMEMNGLLFSKEKAYEIIEENKKEANRYADLILKGVPDGDKINLSSPQQLSAFLYGGVLKLKWREWTVQEFKHHSTYKERPFKKEVQFPGVGFAPNKKNRKDDGYYKVDKDTITGLPAHNKKQRELKRLLVKYSEHAKVVSTLEGRHGNKGYLSKLQMDGCLHPNLNQTVAATGRLTSSNPNGQNLPRGNTSPIKTCFIPRHDGIMQVDLSQIEWRDAAWLSQDKMMIEEINAGVDQHIATAVDLMELEFISKDHAKSKKNRDNAKVFNFRMIYGGTEWGFYLDIDMPSFSIKKWKRIIRDFFKKYSGLEAFHRKCIKFVYRNGYLKLPTGRWFKFHKANLKGGEYGYPVNQIKNYPTQGMSGGDILPLMAVIIRRGMRKMGLKSKLILTVHDSIVFDYVNKEKDRLARLCYNVGNNLGQYIKNYYGLDWNVKLECEVEVGPNYGEMKEIKPEEVGL
jgi:DNA polymerase-1